MRFRGAILALLLGYSAFLCSQDIAFSREYETVRSSVPLQIINKHSSYFYVLRYNKPAHDLTIERRSKPDARILSFTPLKLDSVNAGWFDYESLGFLCYESEGKVYFVFEKELNTRRAVYLKSIDTTGKASGFKELAVLEKDATVSDFRFIVKTTAGDKLLVMGEQYFFNNTAKKVALLYDPAKGEKTWIKKLPLENAYTGFSWNFECNTAGDLFYTLHHSRVEGYRRRFLNNAQAQVAVLGFDTLTLVNLPMDNRAVYRRRFSLRDSTGKKSLYIFPSDSDVTAVMHGYSQSEAAYGQVFFLARRFSSDLSTELATSVTPLDREVEKQLTFYDGSDHKEAWDKDHDVVQRFSRGGQAWLLAGREEEDYSKELLLWRTDLRSGRVTGQFVVPRKVFYFDDRTRFKHMGEAAAVLHRETLFTFVLESPGNREKPAAPFGFHGFAKQRNLWGGNLVAYVLRPGGEALDKKIVYHSGAFSFVPLLYEGGLGDFVFYLNNGRREKFAILNLSSF